MIVAVHEAGHAVACIHLGVPFDRVEIGSRELQPTPAGVWTQEFSLPDCLEDEQAKQDLSSYAERCRKQVIVCLSGPIAERHAAQHGKTWGIGLNSSRQDDRDARLFTQELIKSQMRLSSISQPNRDPELAVTSLPELLVNSLAEFRTEAEELVSDRFEDILRIAELLRAKRTLSDIEVREIL